MFVHLHVAQSLERTVIDPLGRFEPSFIIAKVPSLSFTFACGPFIDLMTSCMQTEERGATPAGVYYGRRSTHQEHSNWNLQKPIEQGESGVRFYIPPVIHFMNIDDGL